MFRKAALDYLSSPEELDQVMRVTTPGGWLALLALGILLALGLAWSVLATIPTTVEGRGVLAPLDGQGDSLGAVVFVSIEDGKRIQPGMPARISLASVKTEESGLALGTVRAVAGLPANQQEMLQAVGNDAFVQTLAAAGDLIKVQIVLLPDPSTPSGYRWSSRSGPQTKLQKGMLCNGVVTIAELRPISLVIPQ